MIQTLAFYFFSAVCLALFGISVFSKNVLYALSALAGGMVFMSGFFFLLDAEFLGVAQIIFYLARRNSPSLAWRNFLLAGCGVFRRGADHSLHGRRDRALRLRADVFRRG